MSNDAGLPRRDIGDILAVGFGTAVAMWLAGYLGRLPGVEAPAAALFAAFVMLLGLGGWAAGRFSWRGVRGGVWSGAVTGAINLLILGSLLGGKDGVPVPSQMARVAVLWAPSCIILSAAVGSIGAWLATRRRPSPQAPGVWPFWFAAVATAATLILLPLGGAVTGMEAGLAVPDWPSSFGYNMFLFPLAKMTGGIYFEHSHRLFGSLVGLTTLTLALYLGLTEPRRWIRAVAILALAMVIAQGLMGAARVTELNRTLGVIHGVFGQVFFVTLVLLTACLSPTWLRRPLEHRATAERDQLWTTVCVVLLLVQLVLGAVLRHFDWGLHLHITLAVVLLGVVGLTAIRSWALYESIPVLSRLGVAMLWLLLGQVLLGGAALVAVWSERPGETHTVQVVMTTAHQTTGALLLACASLLALWHRRLVRPPVVAAGGPSRPAGELYGERAV